MTHPKNLMKPKTAKSLARDVVDYTPAIPRNPVQQLALARVSGPVSPEPDPVYTQEEISDFAVQYLTTHGGRAHAQDICRALFGRVESSLLRRVGNCLSYRMRQVGDIARCRINTHVKGAPRALWFLPDPGRTAPRQTVTLLELAHRLDRLDVAVQEIKAGQERLRRILTSIFKHQEWPE